MKNSVKKTRSHRFYESDLAMLKELCEHYSENETEVIRLLIKQRHDSLHRRKPKK